MTWWRKIRTWLRNFFHIIFPPDTRDWRLMPYQPFLFTSLWVGGLTLLFFGDFKNIPRGASEDVELGILPPLWLAMLVLAPPMALFSAFLIVRMQGKWRYRGFLLRLSSDIAITTAMVSYLIPRVFLGNYHIMPVAVMTGSTAFSFALIYRDIRTLVTNERMANKILRGNGGGGSKH